MKPFGFVVIAMLFLGLANNAHAADEPTFNCIQQGVKIRNTYIRNADPAKQAAAVKIFQEGLSGTEYPVGTVLQLVPGEAMIKHTRAEFPNTSGWEFFALDVSATGTKITSRGETASNPRGTCLSCHQAGAKFDMVCEKTHGCAPVPLTDEIIAQRQKSDPRCADPKSAH